MQCISSAGACSVRRARFVLSRSTRRLSLRLTPREVVPVGAGWQLSGRGQARGPRGGPGARRDAAQGIVATPPSSCPPGWICGCCESLAENTLERYYIGIVEYQWLARSCTENFRTAFTND